MAGSFYGKFFIRNLRLSLFKRNIEEWKNVQASSKPTANDTPATAVPVITPPSKTEVDPDTSAKSSLDHDSRKRKRVSRKGDEIDELFESAIGKKVKRAELGVVEPKQSTEDKVKKHGKKSAEDKDLEQVFGAIKSAPKDDSGHRKKRAK